MGSSNETPYSKASTASSERGELMTWEGGREGGREGRREEGRRRRRASELAL